MERCCRLGKGCWCFAWHRRCRTLGRGTGRWGLRWEKREFGISLFQGSMRAFLSSPFEENIKCGRYCGSRQCTSLLLKKQINNKAKTMFAFSLVSEAKAWWPSEQELPCPVEGWEQKRPVRLFHSVSGPQHKPFSAPCLLQSRNAKASRKLCCVQLEKGKGFCRGDFFGCCILGRVGASCK